jgi:glycosidase
LPSGCSRSLDQAGSSTLVSLATDTDYVRGQLAAYANDLISLGVDGLRLDAAKHQNPSDIANVLSRLTSKVYVTQEVIWGANVGDFSHLCVHILTPLLQEGVQPSMYTGNGDVQEFRYTTAFQQAFNGQNGGIAALQNLDSQGWIAGTGTNVFVANHDTERGGNSLNYQSPSNEYTTAMVLSLAHPYGTPSILSSYQYSSYDQGAPNNSG